MPTPWRYAAANRLRTTRALHSSQAGKSASDVARITWLNATSSAGGPSPPFDQSMTTGPCSASRTLSGWKSR